MGGRSSRNKGKRGEREAAAALQEIGIYARRGIQFRGGEDSPDVISDLKNCHIEVKRVEKLSLYKAIDQAVEDGGGKVPVVLHRKNGKPWVVITPLENLPDFVKDVGDTLFPGGFGSF